MSGNNKFSTLTASSVVIANMIGTGVFTSLGFQLLDISSGFPLIMLWVVGGITALSGALSYAELGAAMPRSGGEYNFLGKIYHPMAGFISGWVSATIGFAAPTALAALTFGTYLSSVYPTLSPLWLATGILITLTVVHATNRKNSARLQQVFTGLKILLILVFSATALSFVPEPQPISFMPMSKDFSVMTGGAFAVALIYVNYAYTGWNAATYLSGELERPQVALPKILFFSTLIVTVSYVLLNYVFLSVAPIGEMVGKVEIGYIAAKSAYGPMGASIMGVVLSLLLISTVSAMIVAGPRVLQVIGEDFKIFRIFGRVNEFGIPSNAIIFQSTLSLIFLWTASFESILVFTGATLALNSLITVMGLFVLRWRQPDLKRPYKTWAYPLPPLIFMGITGWTLFYIIQNRPEEAQISGAIIMAGAVVYIFSKRLK